MPHPFVPLKKHKNYFITTEGYVFQTLERKEIICKARQLKRSKRVAVLIDNKEVDLLNLMLEHFQVEFKAIDRIKFSVTDDCRIPLNSIHVKRFVSKYDLEEEDEMLLFKYKCDIKANTANSRAADKVTALQVYWTLKIHNYRCVYCACELNHKDWHLDHFISLYREGKNIFENLVPSCSMCNVMKGTLNGHQFHKRCRIIAEKYAFSLDNVPMCSIEDKKVKALTPTNQ